jgi:hypothetical protein
MLSGKRPAIREVFLGGGLQAAVPGAASYTFPERLCYGREVMGL